MFGWTATDLSSSERLILIVFVIGFPCILLFVFYWLVTRHHHKLYAPSDYRSDEAFLKAFEPAPRQPPEIEEQEPDTAVVDNLRSVPEASVAPNAARDLGTPINFQAPLQSAYLAEALSISELEQNYHISFRRNVGVDEEDHKFRFDAVADTEDKILVADVKYLRGAKDWKRLSNKIVPTFLQAKKYADRYGLRRDLVPILVLVTSEGQLSKENFMDPLVHELQSKGVDVKVFEYQLQDLLEKYGLI